MNDFVMRRPDMDKPRLHIRTSLCSIVWLGLLLTSIGCSRTSNAVWARSSSRISLRNTPSSTAKVRHRIRANSCLEVMEAKDGWALVLADHGEGLKAGWTAESAMTMDSASTEPLSAVTVKRANVRSRPNTSSTVRTTLAEGAIVKTYRAVGPWYRLSAPAAEEEWIHKSLITHVFDNESVINKYFDKATGAIERQQLKLRKKAEKAEGTRARLKDFLLDEKDAKRLQGVPGDELSQAIRLNTIEDRERKSAKRKRLREEARARKASAADAQPIVSALLQSQLSDVFKRTIPVQRQPQGAVTQSGYSEAFSKVRQLLHEGHISKLPPLFEQSLDVEWDASSSDVYSETDLATLMDRGHMKLLTGDTSQAIDDFTEARDIILSRYNRSLLGEWTHVAISSLNSAIVGVEELAQYEGATYEKIAVQNMLAIAYLLEGSDKSVNVTKRATAYQASESKVFKEKVEEAKAKFAEFQELEKKIAYQCTTSDSRFDHSNLITRLYNKVTPRTKVADPFVNPFSYYVNGAISEFNSLAENEYADNAKIMFEKAQSHYPTDNRLKRLSNTVGVVPKSKKLLHVVMGSGFTPEKRVLHVNLPIYKKTPLPVKFPVIHPLKSEVLSIEVRAGEKSLGKLTPLANVEGMSVYQQKNNLPIYILKAAFTTGRYIFETEVAKEWIGDLGARLLGELHAGISAPDTRAWLTLPRRYHIGRFVLPKNVKTITLVARRRGKKSLQKILELSGSSNAFIYGHATNGHVYGVASKEFWTD